ncbi:hypothetical protein IGI04_023480 [Brassica rapa subsp. trilocularis]|uniref:Uncharacterized protein n=1 Tax=Brassica rapa subsp. trilocularis TaxID=1813537 RepID=A0ABQ7M3Y8_BRACM|nr:hypothetical protein IGI04_023480 [Brassica rapa subsp. trilocularis]
MDQTDQNVSDVPAEVHPTDQIRQIERAVYRLDPRTSGLELRPDPRPDSRTDQTEACLSRPTRQAKTDSQARLDLDHARIEKDHARLEKDHARLDLDHKVSQNDRDFSLLARLAHIARTGDRTDGLIDPFDQFMHFDQPNLTKARILHLFEDIGRTWSSLVHDLDMVVNTDSPTSVVLLTANLSCFLVSHIQVNTSSNRWSCESYQATMRDPSLGGLFSIWSSYPNLIHSSEPILGSFKWYQSHSFGTMSSDDERNRPGNSVAGLSNLQMLALNDSMSNMLNTGLDQIHQRLDEIQASQALSRARARRDRPRRNTRQIDRAVYRLDPRTSRLELRPDPRLDARTDRTKACLSRPTRQAKTDSQARLDLHARLENYHARLEKDHARLDLDHEVSQNDRDFSLLARLAHTGRTGDLTDGPF